MILENKKTGSSGEYFAPERRIGSRGFIMRKFIVYTVQLIQSGQLILEDLDGQAYRHNGRRKECFISNFNRYTNRKDPLGKHRLRWEDDITKE
jgi:hypothetical protein